MPPEAQLFVILLVLVLFWFVLMRPARNQQRRMQELQHDLQVGEEVVLSSGIFGTIRSLDDEGRVRLEVAPGTELTVARQAVVRRVLTDTPEDAPGQETD
jgi:preprotein translocase subunit YajC